MSTAAEKSSKDSEKKRLNLTDHDVASKDCYESYYSRIIGWGGLTWCASRLFQVEEEMGFEEAKAMRTEGQITLSRNFIL